MSSRRNPATITLMYAALAALWIVVSANLLNFATDDPVLQTRVELLKGLAFVAVTSGLLYLILRTRAPLRSGESASVSIGESRRLMPLLFVMALSIPLLGLGVYALHARQDEQDAFADLAAKVRLKSEQIEAWLAERRADSSALAASDGFVERVAKFRATGDVHEESVVRNRLESLMKFVGHDAVTVFDPEGRPLLAYGESLVVPESVRTMFAATLATGRGPDEPHAARCTGAVAPEFRRAAPSDQGGQARSGRCYRAACQSGPLPVSHHSGLASGQP